MYVSSCFKKNSGIITQKLITVVTNRRKKLSRGDRDECYDLPVYYLFLVWNNMFYIIMEQNWIKKEKPKHS